MNRSTVLAAALSLAFMPTAGWTQQGPTPQQELENAARLAQEAVQRMLRALQGTIDNLPQYAPPEIMPNGDIIIRRLPLRRTPDATPSAPPAPGKAPGEEVKT